MSSLSYASSGTDSAASSSSSSSFNDDASVYIIAVMLAAEQQEQEVMSTQATTTEYMSEAATDCSDAWTNTLEDDNTKLAADSDNVELQQQFQTDLTKSNNANQKFTTETEALSANEN